MADGFREYRFDGFSVIVDTAGPIFYDCDDDTVIVAAFTPTEPPTARLERNGVIEVTRLVRAASGAKYAGERGLVFWTKGDEATVEWPQGSRFSCRVRP